MNNYNSYERISNLFTILASPQADATIENISSVLDLPESIIREDLQTLFQNDTFSNNRLDDDNNTICLDANAFQFPYGTTPIYIYHAEKSVLSKYFPNLLGKHNHKNTYLIKESPYVSSKNLEELCDKIQLAIDNNYYVKFTYRDRKKQQLLSFEIEPHLLYHNVNNGRIYLINIQERIKAFRLDLILSLTELPKKKCLSNIPAEKLQLFDYLWGMDLSFTEVPCHVKVKFEAHNHNMLTKIRTDISRRKYAQLYQNGSHWYYEDDIIGMSAFRSWIYQFGYSATVLAPESLAREIYESALKKIENYKENRFVY